MTQQLLTAFLARYDGVGDTLLSVEFVERFGIYTSLNWNSISGQIAVGK